MYYINFTDCVLLAGAGDNTNCYYAPRVTEKMGGHVSQLAKAVMIYSPWQFLYWYDRLQNSSDNIGGVPGAKGFIENYPELDFYKNMPNVWDETKVIEGEIGKFATIARRSGDDWFLGSLTANQHKTIQINPVFLKKGSEYIATIYSYDLDSESSTKVKIEQLNINSETELHFYVAANSGIAMYIRKKL